MKADRYGIVIPKKVIKVASRGNKQLRRDETSGNVEPARSSRLNLAASLRAGF